MSAIPFLREFDFEYGRCDRVSPLIRRVVAPNPGPFTYAGTGVYIVGSGEVAVIDPGPVLDAHEQALDAALEGERVTHVLVTHHHLDHSPLAAPLARKHGCKVYGYGPPAADMPETEVRLEAGEHKGFAPDVRIGDGRRIEGPGWTLTALHTPGHTSNHLCFALEQENALFSGDHVMGWSTTVISPPDGDMGDYIAQLQRVRALGFDTLWPTHGPPVTAPGPFLDACINHRLARETQVLAQLGAGRKSIKNIVKSLYADVDPRLHPAAAHSVWAHLVKLVREGRAACSGAPDIDGVYTPL
ncbi:MAG: MBL fold metallo-hydrolase [Maricaulaceae bacterium]|nr:MBL fold metallo-hydrolase [Maricaulaceae bacterium]